MISSVATRSQLPSSRPIQRALDSMNPYARAALDSAVIMGGPAIGGMCGGAPGVLAGLGVQVAYEAAAGYSPATMVSNAIWPAVIGISMIGVAPSPVSIGLTLGLTAGLGALSAYAARHSH